MDVQSAVELRHVALRVRVAIVTPECSPLGTHGEKDAGSASENFELYVYLGSLKA